MAIEDDLAEAKVAYHRLVTGTAAKVYVDQNGERVEYVAANAGRLAAYIQRLEALVANKTPMPPARIVM